ncbi:YciN family protein [Escherichia coli]
MNKETQPIDRETLLKEANKIIREHEDTLAGIEATGVTQRIEATGVTQRNGVLVFTGDYFLDEQGLPTAKSTAVFNMFKHLAHVLSEKYHLVD